MSQLRSLFLEAVGTCFAQRILEEGEDVGASEGELEVKLEYCLMEMLILKRQGAMFDIRTYSQDILALVKQCPDSDETWEAFGTYCYFQCMVCALSEFPGLIKRLRSIGLGEWAELQADQETLCPFAWRVIRGVEKAVRRDGDLPQDEPVEAAELIEQISELFDIPLSRKLQELVDLYLTGYSNGDDRFGIWPGATLQ